MISRAIDQFKLDVFTAQQAWNHPEDSTFRERFAKYTVVAAKSIAVIALALAIGFGIAAIVTTTSPYIAVALAALAIVGTLIAFGTNSYMGHNRQRIRFDHYMADDRYDNDAL